jgi:hypothetical protein
MASPEQIQRGLDTKRYDAFIAEVARDKQQSSHYGREFGARMQRRAGAYNQNMIESGTPELVIPELRGPWLDWADVLRQYEDLQGWKEYGDSKAVFGTSNNRADSSEIIKMAGWARALELSGHEAPTMLYFIDPCAHTTAELLKDMAQDLGVTISDESEAVDTDIFFRAFSATANGPYTLETRDDIVVPEAKQAKWLPPYFLKPPTVEQVMNMELPERLATVKQMMVEAAEAAQGTHMGNWRIELDRRMIANYLSKVGLRPDLLRVESFEGILQDAKNIGVTEISERARHAWTTYRPIIIGGGDAAAERMPVIMRLVHKGKRVNIDADFNVFEEDISNGRKPITDEDTVRFAQEIQGMDIHTLMTTHPVNMGGVGYAILCARLAEYAKQDNPSYDPNKPIATFMTDHYTLPHNMGILSSEIMRGGGLDSVWITKGTRGRRIFNPETGRMEIDYWTPPDMMVDADRRAEDMGRDRAMIDALAEVYLSNDAQTHSGSYYDSVDRTEVGPKFVPVPTRTIDLIAGSGDLTENELGIALPPMERKAAWKLVNGLVGLTPERFNEIIFGKDSEDAIHIGSSRELTVAIRALEYMESSLGLAAHFSGPIRDRLHDTLSRLQKAAAAGERLYNEHRTLLSPEEWVTYWDNKIQAYTQIAGEEGIALPDSYREPAGTDPEEMEKRASGSAAPFLEAVKSNRRQELMKDRPEVIAELGGGLADVIGFRDRYKQLRNLKFSLRPKEMRPGTVIDPKVQAEREQALIEQRLALGFAPDATEADIDPAIAAVSAALEAVANPTVDTIMSRVAVPAEEPKQKGKTKEIPPEEERLIFDRKQNVSDQLNRRIQQAQNGLAFMSKLHDPLMAG